MQREEKGRAEGNFRISEGIEEERNLFDLVQGGGGFIVPHCFRDIIGVISFVTFGGFVPKITPQGCPFWRGRGSGGGKESFWLGVGGRVYGLERFL
jgi:hypothetical protein